MPPSSHWRRMAHRMGYRGVRGGELRGMEDLVKLWALRLLLPRLAKEDAEAMPRPDVLEWLIGSRRATRPGAPRSEMWRTYRKALRNTATRLERRAPVRGGAVCEVVDSLGELAGLDPLERDVLLFSVAVAMTPLAAVAPDDELSERDLSELVGTALRVEPSLVGRALAPEGALRTGGLVKHESSLDLGGLASALEPSELVLKVCTSSADPRRVIDHIVPRAPAPTCSIEDFEYLGEDLKLLRDNLVNALASGQGKLGVLLYGPPGVGKSELARALAASLGAVLHEVRFEDGDGDAMDSSQRLLAYRLVQRLLGRTARTMLVFEEIEDLFPVRMSFFGMRRETPDMKALTNRTLEEGRVPTFFVSNEIAQMDPAVMRRFDYVLPMTVPPRAVRQRMLARHVGDLPVRPEWLRRIAERADLTPASMERAARFVRGTGYTEPAAVEAAMERVLLRGAGETTPKRSRIEQRVMPYDLGAVRTDRPLAPIIEGLRREGRGTLLFAGLPGTGKTEAAHEIADALDRPLVVRAASDLLSMWVGGTEKNLARAFEEATAERAVLLLDEIDSLLRPRSAAHASWEHSQVNQLLVEIERFDGVLIGTTNLLEGLDPAAHRRFAVKVQFSPPSTEQRWNLLLAALRALDVAPPPVEDEPALRAALGAMHALAPGHFAAAVRNSRLAGAITSASELVERLRAEHSHEPSAKRRAGFA